MLSNITYIVYTIFQAQEGSFKRIFLSISMKLIDVQRNNV